MPRENASLSRHRAGQSRNGLALLCDVLLGILAVGFTGVLLLDARDANMAIAREAAEAVSGERGASIQLVNWWQLVTPSETAGMFRKEGGYDRPGRGHGGRYEASVSAAFAPEAVDTSLASELPPRPPLASTDRTSSLTAGCAGFIGERPRAEGEAIVDQALERLADLLKV